MNILLAIHSFIRWIILLIAIAAIVKFAIGWLRGGAFKGMDRGLAFGFSGLMDLQATLGIILLLGLGFSESGSLPMYRIVHGLIMIVAAVIGHLPTRWKTAPDAIRFRNTLFCILGSLLLVIVGVLSLP